MMLRPLPSTWSITLLSRSQQCWQSQASEPCFIVATGTKSISAMCRAIVFRLVPTSLEIVAVVSVLSRMFRPEVAAIVATTSLVYIAFTAAMTQVW
jgi:ABC-type transport system involved in Fe-S cluster assembly fused permease/ATPase subunit